MNPQNLGRVFKYGSELAPVAGRVGSQALEQLKLFGRALEDAGIFRGSPANRASRVVEGATTQSRIPYTQPGRGAQAYSPSKSLTNPPSAEELRSATSPRAVDMSRVPVRGESPGQMSIFAAPEPKFTAVRQPPRETFAQLQARDPGTAQSVLDTARRASEYHGIPQEEVLRNVMGPNGTGYLRQLEGQGPGSLVRAGDSSLVYSGRQGLSADYPALDELVSSRAVSQTAGGGRTNYPQLTQELEEAGGALRTSPGGALANRNVPVPEGKFYIDVDSEFVPVTAQAMRNATGGVQARNLGAVLALLGGGAAALQGLRGSQGGQPPANSMGVLLPSIRHTRYPHPVGSALGESTAQAPDPLVPLPSNQPMSYQDPSAGAVKLGSNDARESAVREQMQQYVKGSSRSGASKYEQKALLNQAAQREAGMSLMPEILKGLGYTTKETAGLAQWAVAHPELALAEYNRQIQRGAVASNLNVRSEFPSPRELAPSDPINQSPAGVIEGQMVNTPMGSNFVKNAVANSRYVPEAYMTGSQAASELADATQPLVQPTLLTDQQYEDQADSRLEDLANIQSQMLQRALDLRLGSSGY